MSSAQQHIRLARNASAFSSQTILDTLAAARPVRLTYLNPQKLCDADLAIYEDMSLRVDGRYLAWLFGNAFNRRVERASFDFSSLADKVFSTMKEAGLSLAIIGATDEQLTAFSSLIATRYGLDIRHTRNGYMGAGQYPAAIEELRASGAQVVLIGMGTTKQDEFAALIAAAIPTISIFTCGAFISQTAAGLGDYYPALIKALDLRWLYRFFREPRTIARVLKYYPRYYLHFYRDRARAARLDDAV